MRAKPALLVTACALAAYLHSLGGAFQFDDFKVIVDYAPVHSLTGWLNDLAGIRPLLKLTYTLNWMVDPAPFGFHLVNIALHLLNVLMILHLSTLLLGRRGGIFTALLFALHPVMTEAVTYISGRSMSLMTCLSLASLTAYEHGRKGKADPGGPFLKKGSPRPLPKTFILSGRAPESLLLFMMAVLVKETALILPLGLLLWELARQRPLDRAVFRAQAAHWGVLILAGMAVLVHPGYFRLLFGSLGLWQTGENLLAQVRGLWYLITRLFTPWGMTIDPGLSHTATLDVLFFIQAGALVALLGAGFVMLRRRPVIGFAILWFFLQLLPTNSFIPRLDLANERHLYLAVWGPFLIAGLAVDRLWQARRFRQPLAVGCLALLLTLGFFTIQRNLDYRSEIALWEDTTAKAPHNARAWNNLGWAYQLAGRFSLADCAYTKALARDPGYPLARSNLAYLRRTYQTFCQR